jgi:hypothetical protein
VVYAGGAFTSIGGLTRNRLAALEPSAGLATSWNPNASDTVFALVTSGDALYVGGAFAIIGGLNLRNLAAIDGACTAPGDAGSTSATLTAPQGAAHGDFDADGKPDVAVAVASGAQVLRNIGSRQFSSLAVVGTPSAATSLTTTDLNADGALDLAIGASAGVYVALGQRNGAVPTGTFGAPALQAVGGGAAGVAAGDLNHDGIPDLAAAASSANQIAVLLGQGVQGVGNGTFGPAALFATGLSPSTPLLADFNGDAVLDVAVTNAGTTTISVLLGDDVGGVANGSFDPAVAYAVGGTPRPIAPGDFNEDGIVDLVVGTTGADGVSLLRGLGSGGSGSGAFAAAVSYGPLGGPVRDLEVADFDSDGRADVAAVLDNGQVQYLYGDGSGTLGNGTLLIGTTASLGGTLTALVVDAFDALAPTPTPIVAQSDMNRLVAVEGVCAGGSGRTLEMIGPNGGEAVTLGSTVPIQWRRGALVMGVHVEVSRDDGVHWQRLASNLFGAQYTWRVTPPGASQARVRVVDATMSSLADASNGSFTMSPLVDAPGGALPARPSFSLGYPNPARGEVRFDLRLPVAAVATVEVFDLAGRRVHTLARGLQAAGDHALVWDGRTASGGGRAAGLYFVRARASGFEWVRRVARID